MKFQPSDYRWLREPILAALLAGAPASCQASLVPLPPSDSGPMDTIPRNDQVSLPDRVSPPVDTLAPDVFHCAGELGMECLTDEAAVYRALHPFTGGDETDAGLEVPPRDPTSGCVSAAVIADDCCSPAITVERSAELCCYTYCRSGCCGRPLEVDHVRLLAPWYESHGATNSNTRSATADAWRADAQHEHASVASFARFALELLRFGAPADLVRGALQAGLDEVRHAQDCFRMAALLDGHQAESGPLPLDTLPLRTLDQAVRAAVLEGCVGETLSALVLRARAQRASAVSMQHTLHALAEDEARHGLLAWRFVAWALQHHGQALLPVVNTAFRDGLCELSLGPRKPSELSTEAWEAAGFLREDHFVALVQEGFAQVIQICQAALPVHLAA